MFFNLRVSFSHVDVPPERRHELGIEDNLLRFSVGLEDVDDLINDLDQALKKTVKINFKSIL